MILLSLTLFVLPLLSVAAPAPFTQICNETLHFDCQDASRPCIPLDWICNGVSDCPNGQDEYHCNFLHECGQGMMMCRNGECVSLDFRCDGQMDCFDGSDENGCQEMAEIMDNLSRGASSRATSTVSVPNTAPPSTVSPSRCGAHQYQCNGGACIDEESRCDGTWDCPSGDDEMECPSSASLSTTGPSTAAGLRNCSVGSLCPDQSACIPNDWFCDGERDCEDGSDEEHCEMTSEEEVSRLIEEIKRIRMEERSTTQLPTRPCEKGEFQCTHYCTDNVDGYQCSCLPGYVLHEDGQTCYQGIDIAALMTVFTLHTNVPSANVSTEFVAELSSTIAEPFKKPERFVIVHVIGDQKLSFGGNGKEPAGMASIKSTERADVGAIRHLIEKNLGIEHNRLLIEFVTPAATSNDGRALG